MRQIPFFDWLKISIGFEVFILNKIENNRNIYNNILIYFKIMGIIKFTINVKI